MCNKRCDVGFSRYTGAMLELSLKKAGTLASAKCILGSGTSTKILSIQQIRGGNGNFIVDMDLIDVRVTLELAHLQNDIFKMTGCKVLVDRQHISCLTPLPYRNAYARVECLCSTKTGPRHEKNYKTRTAELMNHGPGIVTLYAMLVGFDCISMFEGAPPKKGMFEEIILYAKAKQTNLLAPALFK